MSPAAYPLLSAVDTPADLRKLPASKLAAFSSELREFLIQTVSTRGGHFAAGLGTVELTVALHYVFDTPHDRIVWDVGHQAYPHKVLTGRKDRLHTIKTPTLVICGDEDPGTPPDRNQFIAGKIPGGRYIGIANSRHLPNVERPEPFNKAMMSFLWAQR